MWSQSLVIVGITTLAWISGVQSSSLFLSEEKSLVEATFVQFIAKYAKAYPSKSEMEMRFENFKRSFNLIQDFNSQPDAPYTMIINHYADMSPDEFNTVESIIDFDSNQTEDAS